MRRVIVVRHGNTFAPGEAPRRIGARTDLPLVASGEAQAARLAAALPALIVGTPALLTSPLLRSRQTAAPIAAALGLKAHVAEWLAEIDHGPDEDQPEAAVAERIGAAALRDWDTGAIVPPGWRVDRDRAVEAWREFLARGTASTAILVTSNGTARFARLAVEGDRHGSLKLRTGAFALIETGETGWRVTAWDERPS